MTGMIKGIIIAAGPSSRLRPLTDNLPKCMLSIKGKPIIQNTIDNFRANGISDISIIKGYNKEKINLPDITYFENDDFMNNNILHSLMHARPKLEEALKQNQDVVVTYSDIWYEGKVVQSLIKAKNPISSIVDVDWEGYYEGRSDHPIDEAENVILDGEGKIQNIGKHVFTKDTPKDKQGEFIGLWKFTPKGIKIFLDHFDRLNSTLEKTEPYQNAKEWQKSYITDIFQEMIDKGEELHSVVIKGGWMEFDTVQDFKRIGGNL